MYDYGDESVRQESTKTKFLFVIIVVCFYYYLLSEMHSLNYYGPNAGGLPYSMTWHISNNSVH